LLKKTRTKSLPPRFNTIPRHRIKLLSNSIDDPKIIDLIVTLDKKYGGVLVIVNTVKMAKRIKILLTARNISANLLHSLFIFQDRDYKENDKQMGILHNQKGIWITTQIAEVSLNIDFNAMVTEISSIDSQVQRWGRVWRNRGQEEYHHFDPNIYITSAPSDSGYIYDSDLVKLTNEELKKKDGLTLSDSDEFGLVQQVFNHKSLEDSRYVTKFYTSLRMLEDHDLTVDSKREAQRLFRRISNINVIPSTVYSNNQEEIDKAVANLEEVRDNMGNNDDLTRRRLVRLQSLLTLRRKSVAVPTYYLDEIDYHYLSRRYEIIIAGMKYSSETGVELAPVPLPIALSMS
jgi:CRISPR-associated endonuclease/helicase Cas3